MNCAIQVGQRTVTLEDGTVLPVVGAFNREAEMVTADHPDCVMVLAGPTAAGQWFRVLVDPPITFH